MMGNGGNAPKISATHTVAVYDPADGRIVHMHEVVILEGGKSITAEQAQKEAMEHAKRRGRDIGKLKALMADPHIPRHGRFRVDLQSHKLIALKPPARR